MNIHSLPDHILTRYPLLPVPATAETVKRPAMLTVLIPQNVTVKCNEGNVVGKGEPLTNNRTHGAFAPCAGEIIRIVPREQIGGGKCTAITIRSSSGPTEAHPLFDPVENISTAPSEALRVKATDAGFKLPDTGDTLLLLGIDEDIESVSNRWCLEKSFDSVLAGLELLQSACPGNKVVVTVPATLSDDKRKKFPGSVRIVDVKPRYPDVIMKNIITAHPLLKNEKQIAVMDCSRLVELHTVLTTGKPVVSRNVLVITGRSVAPKYLEVPIGMTVQTLLDLIGVTVTSGSSIVLGGSMRGRAVSDPSQPITAGDDVLRYYPPEENTTSENISCVNCGRCVRACPATLRVDLIAKAVEFGQFEEARRLGIEHCIDCGCCTAACIVHRPLAFYCWFGKKKLKPAGGTDG